MLDVHDECDTEAFTGFLDEAMASIHTTAMSKGWYDNDNVNVGEKIALMHSELSEALEGYRHGNPPSDHIPEYSALEEEFADVVIRVLDLSRYLGLRLPKAIVAKMKFNETRPHKHGGKQF